MKGFGDMPNEHDMLTGSDSDGRAFPGGFDTTCNNWTSDGTDHKAMLGHSDRSGGGNTSWNSAHMSADCTKAGLIATGGAGHFYCFAVNRRGMRRSCVRAVGRARDAGPSCSADLISWPLRASPGLG